MSRIPVPEEGTSVRLRLRDGRWIGGEFAGFEIGWMYFRDDRLVHLSDIVELVELP